MTHNASKVLLGSTRNSCKDVSRHDADPASFPAGIAVRQSSTVGGLVIADDATAVLIGISLGKDLSDCKQTAVARTGLKVPLQTTDQNAYLTAQGLTITADAAGTGGHAITYAKTAGATAGAEVVSVVGNAISVQVESGVSTATQVKTAIDASAPASALVSVAIVSGATAQTALTATPLANGGSSFVTALLGQPVRVDTTTGKASSVSGTSALTGATYASGALTGVKEDATTTSVVLVDMIGGL